MAQSSPFDPAKTPGTFGAPPPGAPHEVSAPLTGEEIARQRQLARQNAKELAPLKFDVPLAPSPESPTLSDLRRSNSPAVAPSLPDPQSEPVAAPVMTTVAPDLAASTADPAPATPTVDPALPIPHGPPLKTLAELEAEFRRTHPAASDTDSPSRGVPRPIADAGKQITGGWGPSAIGPAQYYALDGLELQTVIRKQMADLDRQIRSDLRFQMATVYPQVRVSITIAVDGSRPDAPVNANAFTVTEDRLITLSAIVSDDQDTPADAIRDDSGLDRPQKQLVQSGGAKFMVDRPTIIR